MVEKDLTIPGHPEISVIGDVMSLDKLPGVAEVAMQSGLYAGHRVKLRASGRVPDKPFHYRDLGSAAYISRGRAVVSAGPLGTGGFIAWWIWLFIHIAFLTGYRNRVGAVLTWWLAFTRDSRKERAFTVQEVKTFRDAYTHPLSPGMPEEAQLPGEEAQPEEQAQPAQPGKPVSAPPPPRQAR
jgi:NADH dehydrogenase